MTEDGCLNKLVPEVVPVIEHSTTNGRGRSVGGGHGSGGGGGESDGGLSLDDPVLGRHHLLRPTKRSYGRAGSTTRRSWSRERAPTLGGPHGRLQGAG
jgi:hypothetical protein